MKKHADLSLVQWRIVFMVHAFGPEISSGAIIERANMDKGLFSRGLKQVIELGLVEGETDPKDQRRILLSLTQKGKAIYERIIVIMRKRQDYLLHNLTDDEIKSVFSALEKLQTNSERINF
ncbi:MAG: MarR family winged helix-turn-helix transcriptional regulator [Ahrensia sp.]|nr:MarR family winged helix-turn-helix transcriptional regulator [Ahrensia sp.]